MTTEQGSCKYKHYIQCADRMIEPLRAFAEYFMAPVLLLAFRCYVGWAFMKAGIGRFLDLWDNSWETQLFLFELEHPVPFLSAQLAAPLTMVAELVLSAMLIAGFMGRFAACALLAITLGVAFTYNHDPDILIRDHYLVWATMLVVVLTAGPGKYAVDHFILKWLRN